MDDAVEARLQSTKGGLNETELNELTVSPTASPDAERAVTTVTPVANIANEARNADVEKFVSLTFTIPDSSGCPARISGKRVGVSGGVWIDCIKRNFNEASLQGAALECLYKCTHVQMQLIKKKPAYPETQDCPKKTVFLASNRPLTQ